MNKSLRPKVSRFVTVALSTVLAVSVLVVGCGPASKSEGSAVQEDQTGQSQQKAVEVDFSPVKDYTVDHAKSMKVATSRLRSLAERYYELAKTAGFDYEKLAGEEKEEAGRILKDAKQAWMDASNNYELIEGIVAGVPSLSEYDVILDAGAPGSEGGEDAVPFDLKLPDGRVLAKPGNFFHNLLEPALWGTEKEFIALEADLDGDGVAQFGEVLPDANVFVASAREMDNYTARMLDTISGWTPDLDGAFTALVTMIPTMDEYFENWKFSRFVSGSEAEEKAFVATSRLVDIQGILAGLNVVYDATKPVVRSKDAALDEQVSTGFKDLRAYVEDIRKQEETGQRFSPEEVDRYGTEAQDMAQELSALVAQAAVKLGVRIAQ